MLEGSEMKKKRSLWTVGAVVLFELNTEMLTLATLTHKCLPGIMLHIQDFTDEPKHPDKLLFFMYGQVNLSGRAGPTGC